jgi:hypothetical protein
MGTVEIVGTEIFESSFFGQSFEIFEEGIRTDALTRPNPNFASVSRLNESAEFLTKHVNLTV